MPEQYYNIRVCSDHFVSGAPSKLYDVTNPDWAPSLKLVYEKVSKRSLTSRSERYDRAVKRRRLCLQELMEKTATEEEELENEDIELDLEIDVTTVIPDNYHSIAVQTDNSFDMIEQNFQHEIEELRRENETLKQTFNRLESELEGQTMNEEYFKDDNKKVLYYTGLSTWGLLMTLFMYIKPYLNSTGKSSLSPFQQL